MDKTYENNLWRGSTAIALSGYEKIPDAGINISGHMKDFLGSRSGNLCPICGVNKLDYDGMLNFACPECGILEGNAAFT